MTPRQVQEMVAEQLAGWEQEERFLRQSLDFYRAMTSKIATRLDCLQLVIADARLQQQRQVLSERAAAGRAAATAQERRPG